MRKSRHLARILAVLTAMTLVWSGPAAPALAQDDAATSPGDQPLEIVVGEERFIFDRNVPIDLDELDEGADDDGDPVFTKADDPLGAVYLPGDEDGIAARYLPESLGSPETSCLSEAADGGTITSGDDVYVSAGPEPDLDVDALFEVGSTDDGRTIYAPSEEQPFSELFADSDEGLIRYVLLTGDGAPATFPGTILFAGQEFEIAPDADVSGTDGLVKVGCLGPFPALVDDGAEAPFTTVYLSLNDQIVAYQALDSPEETEPAEEPSTPDADETEPADDPATPDETEPADDPATPDETEPADGTPVDTEEPVIEPSDPTPDATEEVDETVEATPPPATEAPEPTAVPTDVPEPTAVPTDEPEPTAVPTEAPTPTEPPTQVPDPTAVPTEAPAPTEPPTQAPADPAASTPQPTQPAAPTQAPVDPAAPPTPRPTPPPRVYQPPAVVPTVPPEAPPPAVSTGTGSQCSGEPGVLDANGLPERLPNSIQYGGTGYRFTGVVPVAEAGNLSLLGCVGPFEASRGDAQDVTRVLFLALPNGGGNLFRYEAVASFSVTFEIADDPQSLNLPASDDQPEVRYTASAPWVRSVYSSTTVILYVADPNNAQPDRIFARAVDSEVIAEYVPEGSVEGVSEEVAALAEQTGIQPDLTLGAGGPRYVLVAIWQPFGTTTNGWLTLYGPTGEAVPTFLCGVDPRRLDLLIFEQAP